MKENEWDKYAKDWDVNPKVHQYAEKAYFSLIEHLPVNTLSPSITRTLDFGCGTGALTSLLSPKVKEIVGIDASSEMVKYLDEKQLTNVTTISDYLTDELIEQCEYLTPKFDLIVASSVCAFLPNYEDTLALLVSLLNEDGVIVQWDWLSDDESANTGLTLNRIENAYKQHKVNIMRITQTFEITSTEGSMKVVMAIAKNSS